MIAKVVTRQGGKFSGFAQIDEYIERFEATVRTWRGPGLEDEKPIPEQMDAVAAKGTGRVRNPAYHFVLSWERENVPDAQIKNSIEKALTVLGCQEHQWIASRHGDTKHCHAHVLVNRIHPRTFKAWTPQYDYVKLRGLCRQLDPRWKLRSESAAPSARAADFEAWTGQRSMQSWGREHVVEVFNTVAGSRTKTWKKFHAVLGERAGATYEVLGGVGFIVCKTGTRTRKVRAAAISPTLSLKRLEETFGGSWIPVPYGVGPKRERGYGHAVENWNEPTVAMSDPLVEGLYRRFIKEQRLWKTVGKFVAKEERRIVGERLRRKAETAEAESKEALMILRSLGGVQGETSRMVLSMLVRYDRDQAEAEAKAQIKKITSKRPAELFRQWLKDRKAEGDVSAGVALIRLKKQPLDGEAILSLLGGAPDRTLGEIMNMQEGQSEKIVGKLVAGIRDMIEIGTMGDQSTPEQQKLYLAGLQELQRSGGSETLAALVEEFVKAGTTDKEQTIAQSALLAVAGAGVLEPKTIRALYPNALENFTKDDEYPYSYAGLGEQFAKSLKPNVAPPGGGPIADEDLNEMQKGIKKDVKAVLDGKRPTWKGVYDALSKHGVTYGMHYRHDRKTNGPKAVGGLYDTENYRYYMMPYLLEMGFDRMQGKLGKIVDPEHPAADLTLEERSARNANVVGISKERMSKFEASNKEHQDNIGKQLRAEEERRKNPEKTDAVDAGDIASGGDDIDPATSASENEDDLEGEMPGEIKPATQEEQSRFEDPELEELHGRLHGEYASYLQRYGGGLFDVQRGLYKERESIIHENFAKNLKEHEKASGPDRKISITVAVAQHVRAKANLEDAWSKEIDVLKEASGDRPRTYPEWLREKDDEVANRLAKLVEEQELANPRVYRPIEADLNKILAKDLEWTISEDKSAVHFTLAGRKAFHDDGGMIHVSSSRDKEAAKVALLVGFEKYGKRTDPPSIQLTGSIGYKRRMVQMAAEMGIPISNPELLNQYKEAREEHLKIRMAEANKDLSKEKIVGTLKKEIDKIQLDESLDPNKAENEEDRQKRTNTRTERVDDVIAREVARRYAADGKGVRILEPKDVVEGHLEQVIMFNGRSYAVVNSARALSDDLIPGKKKVVEETVFARVTRQVGNGMVNKIGDTVVVERPLAGMEHQIEYVTQQDRNRKGERTR